METPGGFPKTTKKWNLEPTRRWLRLHRNRFNVVVFDVPLEVLVATAERHVHLGGDAGVVHDDLHRDLTTGVGTTRVSLTLAVRKCFAQVPLRPRVLLVSSVMFCSISCGLIPTTTISLFGDDGKQKLPFQPSTALIAISWHSVVRVDRSESLKAGNHWKISDDTSLVGRPW